MQITAMHATSLVVFLIILALPGLAGAELVTVTQAHMGMAVTLRIDADAGSEEQARHAAKLAFERVGQLNLIFSDYEPESELNQLCRKAGSGPVPVSDELFEVLTASKALAELSGGLLDPTAAPVIRIWRKARRDRTMPDPAALQSALAKVGYANLKLDPAAKTAELTLAGMQLDLGSIAKGYVGDEAIGVLKAHGFGRAIFEAGGDMVAGDAPAGQAGWLVEPEGQPPGPGGQPPMRLANEAMAISGASQQVVEIDGKRVGHVIDPRSGEPISTRGVCLVRSPRGRDADPLATLGTLVGGDELNALLSARFAESEARVWEIE